jgi:hypothetical protein
VQNVTFIDDERTIRFEFSDNSTWSVIVDQGLDVQDESILQKFIGHRIVSLFQIDTTGHPKYEYNLYATLGNGDRILLGGVWIDDSIYYGYEGVICQWDLEKTSLMQHVNNGNEHRIMLFDAKQDMVDSNEDSIELLPKVKKVKNVVFPFSDIMQRLLFHFETDNEHHLELFSDAKNGWPFRLPANFTESIVGHRILQIYETWSSDTLQRETIHYSNHYFHENCYDTFYSYVHIVLDNNEVITITRKHHSWETSYWLNSRWVKETT